jgi:hypothetical protein
MYITYTHFVTRGNDNGDCDGDDEGDGKGEDDGIKLEMLMTIWLMTIWLMAMTIVITIAMTRVIKRERVRMMALS